MLCAPKPNSPLSLHFALLLRVKLLDLQQNSEALEKEERRTHQVKMRHDTLKRLVLIFGIIMTQYLKEKARTSKFEMMYLLTLVRCYPFVRFVSFIHILGPSMSGRLFPHRNTSTFQAHSPPFRLLSWDLAVQF